MGGANAITVFVLLISEYSNFDMGGANAIFQCWEVRLSSNFFCLRLLRIAKA